MDGFTKTFVVGACIAVIAVGVIYINQNVKTFCAFGHCLTVVK